MGEEGRTGVPQGIYRVEEGMKSRLVLWIRWGRLINERRLIVWKRILGEVGLYVLCVLKMYVIVAWNCQAFRNIRRCSAEII